MPKIPEYSEGRGRVSLQGRLAPLPQSTVQAMGAPAQAMAEFSETTRQAVGQYQEVNRKIKLKKDTDDARVWIIKNRQLLQRETTEAAMELKRDIDPASFLVDSSSEGQPDPNSYTSRSVETFNKLAASDKYTPPNKVAEQAWKEETATLRGDYTLDAIKYQSQQRTKQITDTLNAALEDSAARVMADPSKLYDEINYFDRYTQEDNLLSYTTSGEIKDPSDGIYGSLPKHFLAEFKALKDRTLATAALRGLTREDPLAAIKIIKNSEFDNGNMYGISPSILDSFLTKAASNLNLNISGAVAAISEKIDNHVSSLTYGGQGDPDFNTQDSATDFIQTQLFDNIDMDTLEKLMPGYHEELEENVSVLRKSLEAKARVSKVSGSVVNVLQDQSLIKITAALESFKELNKQLTSTQDLEDGGAAYTEGFEGQYEGLRKVDVDGAVEQREQFQEQMGGTRNLAREGEVTTEIGELEFFEQILPGEDYIIGLFEGLTTTERAKVFEIIVPALKQKLTDRTEDGASYYLKDDGVQSSIESLKETGMSQEQAQLTVLKAKYEVEKRPESERTYLTKDQSALVVKSLTNKNQSADALIGNMQAMEEMYGDFYESVWNQLVNNEPAIDSRYSFLSAVADSYAAPVLAEAILTTQSGIEAMFGQDTNQGKYSDFVITADPAVQEIMSSLGGGLSERIDQIAPLKNFLIKAMALNAFEGGINELDPAESVEKFMEQLTGNGAISIYNDKPDDRLVAFVTKEHQDKSGTPLTSVKDHVSANARAILDAPARDFKKQLDALTFNKEGLNPLILPGSTSLGVLPSDERDESILGMYIEEIQDNGYFTMNDEGTGFMLIVPMGGARNVPVMYEDDIYGPSPVIFPFDAFTKTPPMSAGVRFILNAGQILSLEYLEDLKDPFDRLNKSIDENTDRTSTAPESARQIDDIPIQ